MKNKVNAFWIFLYSLMMFIFFSFSIQEDRIYLFRFSTNVPANTFLFIGILFICFKISPLIFQSRTRGFYFLSLIISMVFSIISIMAKFFQNGISMDSYISAHPLALSRIGIAFIGGIFLFFGVIQIVGSLRTMTFSFKIPDTLNRLLDFMYGEHCFLKSLLLMFIIWLPQILVRYPGALTVDTKVSLRQYLGVDAATTQHPILYTVFAGKLIDFGRSIGHPAFGHYILVLIQTILMLLVLAYTLHSMKQFQINRWIYGITLVFFAIAPIFIATATSSVIDGPYSSFFLLLITELVYYLFMHEVYRRSWIHYLLTGIAVFGLFLRQNGIYIITAIAVTAVIMELYFILKEKQNLIYSIVFLAVLIFPAIGCNSLVNHLHEQYNAQEYGTRAMLSMPVQQTARCLLEHGDEIDQNTLNSIQKVLTWNLDEYKEAYDPLSFDTVKQGFNLDASSDDIRDFLRAWLHLFAKYPETCINATLNQTYFLFSPETINQTYYYPYGVTMRAGKYDMSEFNPSHSKLGGINSILKQIYHSFGFFPVLGLLVNQGFTDLFLLAISLYALIEKRGRILFLCVPLLLTLAIVFVGPMVLYQARYTYPIMYCLPLLYGIFFSQKGN